MARCLGEEVEAFGGLWGEGKEAGSGAEEGCFGIMPVADAGDCGTSMVDRAEG